MKAPAKPAKPPPSKLRPGELIVWALIGRKLAEIEAKYPGTRNHVEEIKAAIYGITCGW